MGFFSNIGTAEITNEYKKAIKKLNAFIKRHPENLVEVGDDKLIFVRTRKRDLTVFPFEGVTTYDIICKGIMDFLTHYDPKNEYSYCTLKYISTTDCVFKRFTVNYDEDKVYPLNKLVLEFKPAFRGGVKYYAIDNIFNLKNPDLIRKAVALYYINDKK